jgi:putative addiction module component (TIGR02574 family)
VAASLKRIESDLMRLAPKIRARLAELLISSLDKDEDADVEELWAAEVQRRDDELRSGQVKGIAAAAVFRKARSAIR